MKQVGGAVKRQPAVNRQVSRRPDRRSDRRFAPLLRGARGVSFRRREGPAVLVHTLLAAHSPDDKRLRRLLAAAGASSGRRRPDADLWEDLGREAFDLVVGTEDALPAPLPETVRAIRDLPEGPDVIVLGARDTEAFRADLVAAGALAVLDLGLPDEKLLEAVRALVQRRRDESLLRLRVRPEEYRLGDFASSSPAMRELLGTARRLTSSDTTLLVLGETGVGKEWLARAIHAEGPRSRGPFLAVNCGAIPEGLLESELFGHKRGAFTGATSDRRGQFALAHTGTLFLDEIGEMPPQLQVKLLRVLQEKTIQPVGSERTSAVDVRVMAATNRDPDDEMAKGRLRRDLYYRLGVVTLVVPPLRQRREDVRDLVESYFEAFRRKLGRDIFGIDPAAIRALVAYDWPGNVRELINVMERAVLLAAHEEIGLDDLPSAISKRIRDRAVARFGRAEPLDPAWLERPIREGRLEAALEFDRRYLTALLEQTGGRVNETARRAGMSPRALFDRMRQLGLRKEDFRPASRAPRAAIKLPEPAG